MELTSSNIIGSKITNEKFWNFAELSETLVLQNNKCTKKPNGDALGEEIITRVEKLQTQLSACKVEEKKLHKDIEQSENDINMVAKTLDDFENQITIIKTLECSTKSNLKSFIELELPKLKTEALNLSEAHSALESYDTNLEVSLRKEILETEKEKSTLLNELCIKRLQLDDLRNECKYINGQQNRSKFEISASNEHTISNSIDNNLEEILLQIQDLSTTLKEHSKDEA